MPAALQATSTLAEPAGFFSVFLLLHLNCPATPSPACNMQQTFKFIRRASKTADYEVPAGYHRIAFKEKGEDAGYCAWEAFIFGLVMQDSEVNSGIESGLVAPVVLGPGEEWRVMEGGDLPQGWKVVEVSEATFQDFMPRLGYLFQDHVLDEGKLDAGVQKFILKECTEGTNSPAVARTKYSEIAYWMTDLKEGQEEVTLTDQMWADLEMEPTTLQNIKGGGMKVVGRL